jgi:hypothetical protein
LEKNNFPAITRILRVIGILSASGAALGARYLATYKTFKWEQ